MPAFASSLINSKVALLVPGEPEYLLGSYAKDVANCRMQVTSVAIASNVATVGVQILEGNIPIAGNLITVIGTQTDSGAANVTNVALTTVTISAATGAGTVVYAATGGNQATTADGGTALVPVAEVAEALAAGSSMACAIPANMVGSQNAVTLKAMVSFPSLPTSVIISLEVADYYKDSEFVTVGTVATVSGGALTLGTLSYTLQRAKFARFLIGTVVGGTLPTIIAKLLI